MSWQLGIDLGTTYTAAAVYKEGKATIFPLGHKSAAIPSVVFVKEDGEVLTGDAATRRGRSEPERVARGFKRRIGDETPLILGGAPYHPQALMSEVLKSVMTEVCKREGSDPSRIAISHPANWGGFKKDLLKQTVSLANLDPNQVLFLTEPEAAAISYACNEKMAVGDKIAVYDLGGGSFDAAVLERTPDGFRVLGKPEGIEQLGGVDFDAAVYAHVSRNIEDQLRELDYDDPAAMTAVARLKQDCVEAKEALSSDADASVPVLLPNHQTQVRITRREFEDSCRPAIQSTIEAMHRALASANVATADLSKVLLVGGSSRIPLVSQVVQSELGRPLAIDTHPKHAIALGAAYKAGGAQLLSTVEAATPPSPAVPARPEVDSSPRPANAGDSVPSPLAPTEPKAGPFPSSAFAGSNIPDGPNIKAKAGQGSASPDAISDSSDSRQQTSNQRHAPDAARSASPPPAANQAIEKITPYPSPRQPQSHIPSADPRAAASFRPATGRNSEKPQSKTGGLKAALVGIIAVGAIGIGGAAFASGLFGDDGDDEGETNIVETTAPDEEVNAPIATVDLDAATGDEPTTRQTTATSQRNNSSTPTSVAETTTTATTEPDPTTTTTTAPTTTREQSTTTTMAEEPR